MSGGERTKITLKLTRSALERLIGEDIELESELSRQIMDTITDEWKQRLTQKVQDELLTGWNPQFNAAVGDKLKEIMSTIVGNYLRCNYTDITQLVNEEVQRQLPEQIRGAVRAQMGRVAKDVLKQFDPK